MKELSVCYMYKECKKTWSWSRVVQARKVIFLYQLSKLLSASSNVAWAAFLHSLLSPDLSLTVGRLPETKDIFLLLIFYCLRIQLPCEFGGSPQYNSIPPSPSYTQGSVLWSLWHFCESETTPNTDSECFKAKIRVLNISSPDAETACH